MGDIAKQARDLVNRGAPYSEYPCNQLVHYALTGKKEGHLAKDFLTRGELVTNLQEAQEGDVIVSANGGHCGIFVDSTHFVHASTSQQKAVLLDSSKLEDVFRKNYQIRRIE
jgi:cell wall-associated NlpC family hydrolase